MTDQGLYLINRGRFNRFVNVPIFALRLLRSDYHFRALSIITGYFEYTAKISVFKIHVHEFLD